MTQERTWSPGDLFSADKANKLTQGLHRPGIYRQYTITVSAPDTIALGADGFILLPDGVGCRETSAVALRMASLPSQATELTVTARHTATTSQSVGSPVVYAIETGHLTSISNGVILGWIHYPGGGVALQNSFIELASLIGDGFLPGGKASGDLDDNYPGPRVVGLQNIPIARTTPVVDDALLYDATTGWTPKPLTSLVGTGIPSANFVFNGSTNTVPASTIYADGFREFGVSVTIARVALSQEVAGSAGSTSVVLYKVAPDGTEIQITPTGSVSIPYTAGNKARIVANTFFPGTNTLSPGDRLGMKIVSGQTDGADISLSVVVAGATVPSPTIVSAPRAITQALNASILGNTFAYQGSVYLPTGTILKSESRLYLGSTTATDKTQLQIRRASDGAIVYDQTVTGVPASWPLANSLSIFAEGYYEFWLRSLTGATAFLRGVYLAWEPATTRDLNFALSNASVVGITPLIVGSVYLPAGVLQAGGSFVVSSATGTGVVSLYRGVTLITSWNAPTGARQVVTVPNPVSLPATDWYDIAITGSGAGTTVSLSAVNLRVVS